MDEVVAGNEAALRQLFDRHSPAVLAVCKRIVRDASDAEQVLIDVFWEVWQNRSHYVSNRSSPLTYLIMIARCRSIDRLRSKKAKPTTSIETATLPGSREATPIESLIHAESQSVVIDALDTLDPQQRELIDQAFFNGLTYSQIAEQQNKPLGTIKTQIRQALIRLRDKVRRTFDEGNDS